MSKFIRVYKRETMDEERPLQAAKAEQIKDAIKKYMQQFGKYAIVEAQIKQAAAAEDEKETFRKSQLYNHIRGAKNQKEYDDNEKKIVELVQREKELAENSSQGLLDLDSIQAQRLSVKSRTTPELILICLTALCGNILGNIKIASLTFGTTTGTLITGLLVGYIYCKTSKSNQISAQCLNTFRNLGLALFFAGTGFSTGSQNISFDVRSILYGILITLTAIVCGWTLCKLLKKKHPLHQEFIIAGGMTSSPAYGAISSISDNSTVNLFSFSYFGALLTLITAILLILH